MSDDKVFERFAVAVIGYFEDDPVESWPRVWVFGPLQREQAYKLERDMQEGNLPALKYDGEGEALRKVIENDGVIAIRDLREIEYVEPSDGRWVTKL